MDESASFEPQAVLTRRRAGWNRLLIVVPVLVFSATAWVGLNGSHPTADTASTGRTASAASPAATGSLPQDAISIPAHGPGTASPLWPDQVLGIEVRRLRGLNQSELVSGPEIAVAGWYEAGSTTACPPMDPVELPVGYAPGLGVSVDAQQFCKRSGRMFASSPSANTDGNATYRLENRFKNDDLPALGVVIRPGVVVATGLGEVDEATTPVVFIGRLVWPFDNCARFVTRCRPNLLVDRVVWSGGLDQQDTTSIFPSLLQTAPQLLPHPRDLAALETLGPTGSILLETLVDQQTLAAVDPDAAAAVGASGAERIWYRRVLGLDPGASAPRWVAINDATGDVIAGGLVDLPSGPRLPADGTNVLDGG